MGATGLDYEVSMKDYGYSNGYYVLIHIFFIGVVINKINDIKNAKAYYMLEKYI